MKKILIIAILFVCSVCYGATKEQLIADLDSSISVNQVLSPTLSEANEPTKDNGKIALTLKDYYENERIGNTYKLVYNLTKHKSDGTIEVSNALMFVAETGAYWINGKPQPIIGPVETESFTDKIYTFLNGNYAEIVSICEQKKMAKVKLYTDTDNDGEATPETRILQENDNGDIEMGLKIIE